MAIIKRQKIEHKSSLTVMTKNTMLTFDHPYRIYGRNHVLSSNIKPLKLVISSEENEKIFVTNSHSLGVLFIKSDCRIYITQPVYEQILLRYESLPKRLFYDDEEDESENESRKKDAADVNAIKNTNSIIGNVLENKNSTEEFDNAENEIKIQNDDIKNEIGKNDDYYKKEQSKLDAPNNLSKSCKQYRVVDIFEADIERFKKNCIFIKFNEIVEDHDFTIKCVTNGTYIGHCNYLLQFINGISIYLLSGIAFGTRFSYAPTDIRADYLFIYRDDDLFNFCGDNEASLEAVRLNISSDNKSNITSKSNSNSDIKSKSYSNSDISLNVNMKYNNNSLNNIKCTNSNSNTPNICETKNLTSTDLKNISDNNNIFNQIYNDNEYPQDLQKDLEKEFTNLKNRDYHTDKTEIYGDLALKNNTDKHDIYEYKENAKKCIDKDFSRFFGDLYEKDSKKSDLNLQENICNTIYNKNDLEYIMMNSDIKGNGADQNVISTCGNTFSGDVCRKTIDIKEKDIENVKSKNLSNKVDEKASDNIFDFIKNDIEVHLKRFQNNNKTKSKNFTKLNIHEDTKNIANNNDKDICNNIYHISDTRKTINIHKNDLVFPETSKNADKNMYESLNSEIEQCLTRMKNEKHEFDAETKQKKTKLTHSSNNINDKRVSHSKLQIKIKKSSNTKSNHLKDKIIENNNKKDDILTGIHIFNNINSNKICLTDSENHQSKLHEVVDNKIKDKKTLKEFTLIFIQQKAR
ncbi:hypothetical protein EDEG_03202 [Edhazardia aedis USNM 41457]|uniref:Uncharacterized protein n=1 Tax=Edhazardia aedis (strain USNM 41457) TaxID=1003232 RepID=J9D3E7_EDHAE|nr:hypothetical protein EDEG_03202 [Edhazardia aedis USNM 41457]|eukprot:EJW02371.1 hypothetical protein EDEG_03202 [Edhazardia aedis USNM 41457]